MLNNLPTLLQTFQSPPLNLILLGIESDTEFTTALILE
jgi:hypothetical protein